MRKSTSIVMAILLVGFGSMMMAANVALKPLQRYARIGTDLTSAFQNLDLVQPDSKVFVVARAGDPQRLAKEGWGLLIELAPSDAVKRAPGRLERLTYRACEEAYGLYRQSPDRDLEWFEVKFLLSDRDVHRVLLRLDATGRMGRPEPAVPATWAP